MSEEYNPFLDDSPPSHEEEFTHVENNRSGNGHPENGSVSRENYTENVRMYQLFIAISLSLALFVTTGGPDFKHLPIFS